MTDLRNHLFEVMEALKDEEKPMELARAKAVVDVAQALINSAKVEVDMQRIEARRGLGPSTLPEQRLRGSRTDHWPLITDHRRESWTWNHFDKL